MTSGRWMSSASPVRDTFLPVLQPILRKLPVRSDDVRDKQFSTHRPGYDEKQVAAFFDAAGIRLAAMESTDKPEEPLASGAILAEWADWADSTTFSKASWRRRGYEQKEVDAFREEIRDTFLGATRSPVRAFNVRGTVSSAIPFQREDPHYDKKQVDAFLDAAGIRLAAMEATDRPPEPPVTGTILTDGPSEPTQQDFQPPRWAEWAAWAEWADSTRFETSRRLWEGYATAEVDSFRKELRDTFLGVRPPPLTWDEAHDKQFTPTRLRPGSKVKQVDAFLDKAEQRLAAMRSDAVRRALKRYVARS